MNNNRLSKIVSNNLIVLRKSRNLSLYKIAKHLNISYSYLHDIESGKKNPSLETLQKIIDYFEIEPYELFL